MAHPIAPLELIKKMATQIIIDGVKGDIVRNVQETTARYNVEYGSSKVIR